jgi:hypothetical protein
VGLSGGAIIDKAYPYELPDSIVPTPNIPPRRGDPFRGTTPLHRNTTHFHVMMEPRWTVKSTACKLALHLSNVGRGSRRGC